LVELIRQAEQALGDGKKRVMQCEKDNRDKLRKFIVARTDIKKGEIFTNKNLTTKRTGGKGMDPTEWDKLLDKESTSNFDKEQPIILGEK
jgi:N,N'-diacetyllegionaminate synthase